MKYPDKMYSDLGIDPSFFKGVALQKGRGCERCKNSGYAGRAAIIEVMSMTDDIRKLVIQRASSMEIGKLAINQGMSTLRDVALSKAREGITTLEQVLLNTSNL